MQFLAILRSRCIVHVDDTVVPPHTRLARSLHWILHFKQFFFNYHQIPHHYYIKFRETEFVPHQIPRNDLFWARLRADSASARALDSIRKQIGWRAQTSALAPDLLRVHVPLLILTAPSAREIAFNSTTTFWYVFEAVFVVPRRPAYSTAVLRSTSRSRSGNENMPKIAHMHLPLIYMHLPEKKLHICF